MQPVLENLLEDCIRVACGEGERFIRTRALSAFVQGVRGLRRLVLLAFALAFGCFIAALSVFAAAYAALQQYETTQHVALTPSLALFGGLAAASALLVWMAIRERNWIRAFRVEEAIASLERFEQRQRDLSQQADLARMIAEIVETKLRERQDSTAAVESSRPDSAAS